MDQVPVAAVDPYRIEISLPAADRRLSEGLDLYGRPPLSRLAKGYLGWGLCGLALLLVAAPLASVLWGVIDRALPVWHWSVLTEQTTATGGGLRDEILGTLEIVVGVGILAGLVGVSEPAQTAVRRVYTYLRVRGRGLGGGKGCQDQKSTEDRDKRLKTVHKPFPRERSR